MKKIIIIVPVYQDNLKFYEKVSLRQLYEVLGNYPISYVAPESLNCSFLKEFSVNYSVKRFADTYFKSVDTYSQLCMSKEFYEAFVEYEYMLIYQTDAFCFSDRLEEFCNKGYDFIGAPIPKSLWWGAEHCVGNGGFSLRKIQSFIRVLEQKDKVIDLYVSQDKEISENLDLNVEDQFFAFCTGIDELDFHAPDVREALTFAIEYNIDGVYIDLQSHLPFGCHRWMSYKYVVWKEIIENYGYSLDCIESSDDNDHSFNMSVVLYYLEMDMNNSLFSLLHQLVPWDSMALWGAGRVGRRSLKILRKYEYSNIVLWDSRASIYDDTLLVTEEMLMDNTMPILVTVKEYSEIEQQLLSVGKREGTDFLIWYKVVNALAEKLEIDKFGEKSFDEIKL